MTTSASDSSFARPSWIIIAPFIPREDQASGDRRLVAMLRMLAPSCVLQLVALQDRDADDAEYVRRLGAMGVDVLGVGRAVATRALISRTYGAVFFEFYHATRGLLPMARRLQPQALLIVDSVDVHYLREREAARLGNADADSAEITRIHELTAYRRADVTLVVSSAEARALGDEGVDNTVVVPNIVPLSTRTHRTRTPSVLFVGGFDHAPNRSAVQWCHQEVWPLVRRMMPDAEWIIAGSRVPPDVLALHGHDGVQVAGFVPSTADLLDAVQVSIAPLTFGGGMKGKVSEALAAGVPVVTTRWGAQGLEDGAGTAYLLADEPQAFAAAVVSLLTDEALRVQVGEAGRALARRLCSAEAAAPALHALVGRSRAMGRPLSGVRRALRLASFAAGKGLDRLRSGQPARV